MNQHRRLVWRVVSFIAVLGPCWPAVVHGGAFGDLDFESASAPHPLLTEESASQGLPCWAVNNFHPGTVTYGTIALDAYCVSIHDGHSGYLGDFNPLDGNYSVMLQTENPSPHTLAWISQTGDIPPDANSIMFLSDTVSPPTLSLNGVVIPTSVCNVGPTVNTNHGPVDTYIGDIRAFTGQQNVLLEFESAGNNSLDDIQFSLTVVPEPSTLALLTIAALVAIATIARRRYSP